MFQELFKNCEYLNKYLKHFE